MRLTIKNAEAAYVDLASEPHRLDVDGVNTDDILNHIDIITAIDYYGTTELLDTIGEEKLKFYLAGLKCTANELDKCIVKRMVNDQKDKDS